MKRLLVFLCAMIFVFGVIGSANAIILDFDSLPLGNIDGVNLGGVTITTVDGSTIVESNGGVGYMSALNAITNSGWVVHNDLVLTFDSLVSSVTLTGGDSGGDSDQFTLEAYDSVYNLLGTYTTPIFGGNPYISGVGPMQDFYTANISFAGTKYVHVTDVMVNGIGIDDLEFDGAAVPIPSAILLLGSGLFGLAGFRRKFRKK